jgi:ribonuclease J
VLDAVADDIFAALDRLGKRSLGNDDDITEAVRIAARRSFRRQLDKKPITDVHLIRI